MVKLEILEMLNQTSGGSVAGTAPREATSLSIILSGNQRTVQPTSDLSAVKRVNNKATHREQ